MRRRAFTLLEIVVTLAIVMALAAIAMPSIARRLGGIQTESLARELGAAVGAARSDAVRESAIFRLVFSPSATDGTLRLVARPFVGSGDRPAVAPGFVGPILDVPDPVGVAEGESDRLLLVLPRGTTASRGAPEAGWDGGVGVGGLEAAGAPTSDLESLGGGEWGTDAGTREVTLGVLMPAGGAVVGGAVYLSVPSGSVLEMRLDAWTGAAVVTTWKPPAPEDGFLPEPGAVEAERGARER